MDQAAQGWIESLMGALRSPVFWQWVAVAAALAAGFLIGRLRGGAGRSLRERAEQLESELREARSQLAEVRERLLDQRQAVEKHFEQTSEIFGDLTRQYTTLYSHLAEGARAFCHERVPALGHGLAPLLPADPGSAADDSPGVGDSGPREAGPGADVGSVEPPEPAAPPEADAARPAPAGGPPA